MDLLSSIIRVRNATNKILSSGRFQRHVCPKSNKMFYALLVAITVQSLGLLILTSLGIIEVPTHTFPVLGTIIGSFIFGVGIVLAGGCATGTWYRAGEGLIGSWVALILYAITLQLLKQEYSFLL